ncbi:MAG: RNA polymerase sigma-70 factor [Fermentimonas sp.]|jgi:RNA polymerase sigma-70 factor (ECF subfamily)
MKSKSDISRFNLLYNEFYGRFIKFAYGFVRDEAVAEDIVSDAFTIWWEKKDEISNDIVPQAYLFSIIRNRCINYLNRQKTERRVIDELKDHNEWILNLKIRTLEACDPEYLFTNEMQRVIERTLSNLPSKTRKIFQLNRDYGLTYREIAKQTKLSQKSIEFHMSKALKCLRVALKDYYIFFIVLMLLQ